MPSGQLPSNPSELLGSEELEDLLMRLSHRGGATGRMLVIDAPPLLPVADTQVLLNSAAIDTVLVVTRSGRTTRDEIRDARSILDRHLLQPLGLIVDRCARRAQALWLRAADRRRRARRQAPAVSTTPQPAGRAVAVERPRAATR